MVTRTAGRLLLPSSATTSSGTATPVAVFPPSSTSVRNLMTIIVAGHRGWREPATDRGQPSTGCGQLCGHVDAAHRHRCADPVADAHDFVPAPRRPAGVALSDGPLR